MNIFDDLPRFLQSPSFESVFVAMVRTLLGRPSFRMTLAEFGRLYRGATKVFLQAFFDVTNGDRAEIALRYTNPDPVLCARIHWEARLEMTCKKGHMLMKVTDALICTCFACDDSVCSNGYYRCVECVAFQVCTDCMVLAAQPEPVSPLVHAVQPESVRLMAHAELPEPVPPANGFAALGVSVVPPKSSCDDDADVGGILCFSRPQAPPVGPILGWYLD